MKLIVGLGNPGKKYDLSRHNIGFIVLDYFSREVKIPITKVKFKSYTGEFLHKGEKIILLKPQTYMNLSGEAVKRAVDYYGIAPGDLLVVYDDVDIPLGSIRLRKKGSGGTHNGMRNIVYQLQDDEFPRLRFGIGKNEHIPLTDYVLMNFPREEFDVVRASVRDAASAIEVFIDRGIDAAMNQYNKVVTK
ncbi:MAG: peptidyl-tRNA hydrolase [delta proteobacterium ML8_F1]|nr:MAG: peptidyl-tRNA hydrolase [delta proteobacterium ML8_F1]